MKVTPEVQQIFTLTTRIESSAQTAVAASKEAQALLDKAKAGPQSAANDATVKKLEEIVPALNAMGGQMVASIMTMQAAEMAPTAAELAGAARQESAYAALMTRWTALKGSL